VRFQSALHHLLALAVASTFAGCADRSERQSASPLATSPTVPSAVTAPGGVAGATRSGQGRDVVLPAYTPIGALDVAFPGRDESFAFRQSLEAKYRDGLRRAATSSYVDVEGDLVWTQEYLRYRVNACAHVDAIARVMTQIDGAPAPPVCGPSPAGTVAFPPRNESFDFRQELERKYRDGLRRTPSATYVDVEGAVVWTQEYLRYRVNACGHVAATQKVLDQIDGRGIAPVCNGDLSGLWVGDITDFRAFVMDLVQTDSRVSGTYTSGTDRGFFDGTLAGDRLTGRVGFGDTGILVDARWDGADVVNGDMRIGGGIGLRSFEMRRQR
jgi:hypothetical protein